MQELAEVDQKMLTILDDLSTIISTSIPDADLPGVVSNKYQSVPEEV